MIRAKISSSTYLVDSADISEVPANLIVEGFCNFLFHRDTCPARDLERYVVRLHKLRNQRGDRLWSAQEYGVLKAAAVNLIDLVEIESKSYQHAGLKMSYLEAADAALRVVEILLETYEEREVLLRTDEDK